MGELFLPRSGGKGFTARLGLQVMQREGQPDLDLGADCLDGLPRGGVSAQNQQIALRRALADENFRLRRTEHGGVFSGMAFAYRPDALAFDYIREFAEGADEQVATVLVYAWKGTWTQEEVPGNNSMSADVVKTTMIDRDRNILGMETSQGLSLIHI